LRAWDCSIAVTLQHKVKVWDDLKLGVVTFQNRAKLKLTK